MVRCYTKQGRHKEAERTIPTNSGTINQEKHLQAFHFFIKGVRRNDNIMYSAISFNAIVGNNEKE